VKDLSEAEVAKWCEARGVEVTSSGRLASLNQGHRTMVLPLPGEPVRRVALACALLLLDSASGDEAEFQGCLVRITDSDIWSPTFDRIGQRILRSLTSVARGSEGTNSYLTSKEELVVAEALVSIPLLFEWDAYLVPLSADFIVFISHDGPLEISAKSQQKFEEIHARLESREWDVRERRILNP
jgi:hypothetical protein